MKEEEAEVGGEEWVVAALEWGLVDVDGERAGGEGFMASVAVAWSHRGSRRACLLARLDCLPVMRAMEHGQDAGLTNVDVVWRGQGSGDSGGMMTGWPMAP